MKVNNLTTGDQDPQVNSETQDDLNEEVSVVNEEVSSNVDDSISNEQAEAEAYSDAWDNVDVDDDSIFEKTAVATNEETTSVPAEPTVDPLSTTNETNNNIGAFMVDKPVLKYKGKDIPIDNEAELIALAQKGFRMESEAANMKPKKKALSIIDGIPLEVLQAVADIHGGNTDALGYIKKQYGIEDAQSVVEEKPKSVWDEGDDVAPVKPAVTTAKDYTPAIEAEDPVGEYWNEFAEHNPTGAAAVTEIYSGLDDSFKSELYTEAVFPYFVSSVGSGEFDKAYPLAIKEKSLNPAMTWIQAMTMAVGKIGQPVMADTIEPPVSATPPANVGSGDRDLSETKKADMVWEDDAYFKEIENKLFG